MLTRLQKQKYLEEMASDMTDMTNHNFEIIHNENYELDNRPPKDIKMSFKPEVNTMEIYQVFRSEYLVFKNFNYHRVY
tara:strand:+ start:180 stop:413 length:234 start_codon:yes stop_codon:yes gene_type:complete